jgi:toxin CptA
MRRNSTLREICVQADNAKSMEIVLTSIAFLAAAFLAGVMGFAIQRGATCTVAAMDELVNKRRVRRLGGLVEASLWVVGGLLIAQALHLLGTMPAGYAVSYRTVLGGVLLGLGAFVNGACVFGAIARLGSGEWAYLITPLGFYAGCVSFDSVFAGAAQQKLPYGSPVLQASAWVAIIFAAFMLWRLGRMLLVSHPNASATTLWLRWRHDFTGRVWSPHAATTVIGIAFFFMLLLVGAWAYTDVLAELAHGMSRSLVARSVLLLAMLAGAILGGWTAGRLESTRISTAQLVKCFSGGLLMGWGSLLIPGGNDGLILVGMPLLWPYAWVAFAAMCISIGAALLAQRALANAVTRERA